MGDIEVRAPDRQRGRLRRRPGHAGGAIIPDDAFLELDPISALDHEETRLQPMDELAALAMPEPRRASVPTTRRSTRKA
jgi:type VI secretion system protein ImpI